MFACISSQPGVEQRETFGTKHQMESLKFPLVEHEELRDASLVAWEILALKSLSEAKLLSDNSIED